MHDDILDDSYDKENENPNNKRQVKAQSKKMYNDLQMQKVYTYQPA